MAAHDLTVHELTALASSLQRTFPDLPGLEPLQLLGEGFSSTVLESASGLVFRIGRTAETGVHYDKEARLLPRLRTVLPVAVPAVQWYAVTPAFPYGVIGYPKLAGRVADPASLSPTARLQLAQDLAAALNALHRFSYDAALALPGPVEQRTRWQAQQTTCAPILQQTLSSSAYQTVAAWWERF